MAVIGNVCGSSTTALLWRVLNAQREDWPVSHSGRGMP